jgi:transposase
VCVGIDVAKRSHEMVLLDDSVETRGMSFGIANSGAGMRKLLDWVVRANPEGHAVVFGLEVTSHAQLGPYSHLRDKGYEVVTSNRLQIGADRRLQIRPLKNDRRDA